MKKLVLGVVALGVMVNVALADIGFDGDCKKYMSQIQSACKRGVGDACWLLGEEYTTKQHYFCISVECYRQEWGYNGGQNCAIRETKKALQYYKRACELGNSAGCYSYNEIKKLINNPTPDQRLAE